jgi:hypothetical protein
MADASQVIARELEPSTSITPASFDLVEHANSVYELIRGAQRKAS